ncbi:352aa long hypothetical protein [Pyrococcus horikoshii OT3]|uniref:Saccharopine dehydrogenase n=2 Tax=Pyrococcus horikoshii TaxID=53953 RepID=O59312_PYRHO|nr:352aa long hypothetical protein [Pyrococcus horikoshii OT3]
MNPMKVLILGAGNIGRAIAWDLKDEFDVYIGDVNNENLEKVKEFATPLKVDASNFDKLVEVMKEFELVIGALPGFLGFKSIKAAIKSKVDMVDVSFMPENPLELRDEAEKAQVTIVFDAGFAPGLSNILMGRIFQELDLKEGYIYVGGLPKDPKPPLYYKITWSPRDLIEEYTRPARVIRNGKVSKVDPLSEVKKVKIGKFEFEAFISDGLRSMLETINSERLEEWTLRWPGHLEKIKVLRELGFFKPENLDFTLRVIEPLMRYETKDFSIMKVVGKGEEGEMEFFLYDEEDSMFSSMSRVTGFTAAIISRIVAENTCTFGVIPPEILGMREDTFRRIIDELKERGISIEGT